MRSGQGKGWLLIVALLSALIGSPAWALDLDSEIQKQEQAAQELLPSIGKGIQPKNPENTKDDTLKVQLKPVAKRTRSS